MRYTIKRPTSVGLLSRGKDYSVRDLGGSLQGYTDLLRKELGVSLAADAPQTRWTQLHELSHVRHSLWSAPRIAKRVQKMTGKAPSHEAILAAEDARINELLIRRVRDAHNGFEVADPSQIRKDLGGYVAAHASPRALADLIRPECDPVAVARTDKFLRRLGAMSEAELTVLRVTVPLAQLIDECNAGGGGGQGAPQQQSGQEQQAGSKGGHPQPSDEPPKRGNGKADPGEDEDEDGGDEDGAGGDGEGEDAPGEDGEREDGAGHAQGAQDGGEGAGEAADDGEPDKADAEVFGKPDNDGRGCRGNLPPLSDEGAPAWQMPTVHEPPLTVPMRGGNFQVTSAETGTSLRWSGLHRMTTDGVVFRKARRRPGALQKGTVLIDVSASVSFDNEDLARVVELLPHATVAVYSGASYHHRKSAHIVVVARNGRRVADLTDPVLVPRGGDNMCDGPALLWLSRQPTPRLWICDGYTTDNALNHTRAQEEECGVIMRAAGIVQVRGDSANVAYGAKSTRLCASREIGRGDLRGITRREGGLTAALPAVLKDIERGRV